MRCRVILVYETFCASNRFLGCRSFLRLHFLLLFLHRFFRLTHSAHFRMANIIIIILENTRCLCCVSNSQFRIFLYKNISKNSNVFVLNTMHGRAQGGARQHSRLFLLLVSVEPMYCICFFLSPPPESLFKGCAQCNRHQSVFTAYI